MLPLEKSQITPTGFDLQRWENVLGKIPAEAFSQQNAQIVIQFNF